MFHFTSVCACALMFGCVSMSHGQGQCQKSGGLGGKPGMSGGGVGGGMGMPKPMMGGGLGMSMQRPMPMPMGQPGMPNMGLMTQKSMQPMQMMGRPPMPQQMQPQPNAMQTLLAQQQSQQQQALLQLQWQQGTQPKLDPRQPWTDEQIQTFLRSQSDATLKKQLTNASLNIRLLVGEELKRRGQNSAAIETASNAK